jgi:arylsulfatase A-like enzyme
MPRLSLLDPTSSLHRIIWLLPLFPLFGCGPEGTDAVLTADVPLHLEDQLEVAMIEGSKVPDDFQQPVEWNFEEPQPEWRVVEPWEPEVQRPELSQTEDALRIALGDVDVTDDENDRVWGAIYIDLPDWERDDWAHVQVRARSEADVDRMGVILAFNLREKSDATEEENEGPVRFFGENAPFIHDGTVQTYSLRADWSGGQWEGPWKQLVLGFWADKEASIDILSVTVVPKEATYAGEPAGVRSEVRNRVYSRALYTHTPARIEYQIRVPEAGRLDLGLGVLREDAPVTFRITATPGGGESETVLEEKYDDKNNWGQRSIDLSHLAGQTVDLTLETESPRPGTVALWAAPTLTGATSPDKPNVIFYVIDGGAADFMSVYGYNRRTTPNLEQLAAEGAVFEWAYSNSTWTKPSTASFMTSLQNSVMGGQTNWTDPVPEQIKTMAEHMHEAGHQTAVFVANPNAGTLSDLQRGVDVMKESWEEFTYFGRENHKQSSRVMHDRFWTWREAYPGSPFWVHFQTTDVHRPQGMSAGVPFSGLFVSPEQRKTWLAWRDSLQEAEGGRGPWGEAWENTGIDRAAYFSVWQALYDESMAFNDYQIGRLVERLKAEGEWENTLLIVAADHSVSSAGSDQGIAMQDSVPPRWNRPILRSTVSRIPLMFIWPGHIEGGQRFSQPVSMLDVLPTLLDLMDLPQPEIMMGQSLTPLLLGEEGWEPRPVILDEFRVDQETGELRGLIEVIDGRWGASLEINPRPPDEDEDEEDAQWRRPVPLLLFDQWEDPFSLHSLHEQRPDLVEKYTAFLEAQWEAHQALAQRFTPGGDVELTPQQLETLRSLGYIQ